MITLTIDGREIQAEEGAKVLDAVRENNIYIPALCSHEGAKRCLRCALSA